MYKKKKVIHKVIFLRVKLGNCPSKRNCLIKIWNHLPDAMLCKKKKMRGVGKWAHACHPSTLDEFKASLSYI